MPLHVIKVHKVAITLHLLLQLLPVKYYKSRLKSHFCCLAYLFENKNNDPEGL